MKRLVIFLAITFLCSHTLVAQTVSFDFDSAPLHSPLPVDLTVSGVTAHFSATGEGYSIQEANTMGFTPQGFAGYCIYPSSIYLADLHIRFDQMLTDFSIMYACQELGCDDAATMRVTAYLNGSYVGTNTRTATNPGTWPTDTLSYSIAGGFDSVVIHYDSKPPTCSDWGPIFMADNMIVTPSPLPIQIATFTASVLSNSGVQLEWTTVSETNNYGFYVERREDSLGVFQDVSNFIPGAGTSLEEHHYSWTDTSNTAGVYVYRLRQIDLDGNVNYAQEIRVVVSGVLGVFINKGMPTAFGLDQNYPNPFNPVTHLSYALPTRAHVSLIMYNVMGQPVATVVDKFEEAGYKTVQFHAGKLSSGIYFYRLSAGTFTQTRKLLLMK